MRQSKTAAAVWTLRPAQAAPLLATRLGTSTTATLRQAGSPARTNRRPGLRSTLNASSNTVASGSSSPKKARRRSSSRRRRWGRLEELGGVVWRNHAGRYCRSRHGARYGPAAPLDLAVFSTRKPRHIGYPDLRIYLHELTAQVRPGPVAARACAIGKNKVRGSSAGKLHEDRPDVQLAALRSRKVSIDGGHIAFHLLSFRDSPRVESSLGARRRN